MDQLENENQMDDTELPVLDGLPVNIKGVATSSDPILDSRIPNLAENPVGQTMLAGKDLPFFPTISPPPEGAGFWETLGHTVYETNRITQAGEFLKNNIGFQNPNLDDVPDDWNPLNVEAIRGISNDNYRAYIVDAVSPKDQQARRQHVLYQMDEDQRFQNGSFLGKLLGFPIGALTDPTTYLLPWAATEKSAGIAQTILMNMGKNAPALALDTVSRNLLNQANRVGGNIKDAATDSYADFIFGEAMLGAAAGIGKGLGAVKLWESRKLIDPIADGVNLNPEINANGEVTGKIIGTAAQGSALSAAEVDAATLYANETFADTGIFGVPYVGKALKEFFGANGIGGPIMQAARSPFSTVQAFANRIFPTSIYTKGVSEGIAKADSASEIADYYTAMADKLSVAVKSKFYEANGIVGGANVKNAVKDLKQKLTQERTYSPESFAKEVRSVLNTGSLSTNTAVNDAAKILDDFYSMIGKDFNYASGKDGTFLDPRNAARYLPSVVNISEMINRRDEWIKLTANEYKKQDNLIRSLNAPVEQAEARIQKLQKEIKQTSDPQLKQVMNNELRALIANKRDLQTALETKLLDTRELQILLDDRVLFDSQEKNELSNILEPLRSQQSILEKLNKELESIKKNKSNKEKINELNNKISDVEDYIITIKQDLENRAYAGEINKKFFERDGHEIKFYDPNKPVKFRSLFESDQEILNTASQAFESLTNMSPDQIINHLFGQLGIGDKPKYLRSRTLLIDNEVYNQAGFLDPDITRTMRNYSFSMGKLIGFKTAFPEFAHEKGYEGIVRQFNREYQQMRDAIDKLPNSKTKAKKTKDLYKERKKAEDLMKNIYNAFIGAGERLHPEAAQWSRSVKNLVAAAKLGAVPIYQLSELGAMTMKGEIMPLFAQNLRPIIKSLNGWQTSPYASQIKGYAGDACLALNTVKNAIGMKLVNSERMGEIPISNMGRNVGIWTENLAHTAGNLFGTNWIANINEMVMAQNFQSSVMRAMFEFKDGTLAHEDRVKMAHYGIDVERDADAFIKAYNDAGGYQADGGYHSLYYQWADTAAARRMAMSIRRCVHDTVVNSNLFTSPFWSHNPFMSMVFMFHGWAYGAFVHYGVPTLQRPTAKNILGITAIVGMSMLANPLLRMANGKDPYTDDTSWYEEAYKGIDYSGILGPYPQLFQDINSLTGDLILPGLQGEKYKQRGLLGGAGPVVGYASDLSSVIPHVIKNDMTENDAKRLARLVPFNSALYLRSHINKYIESMNLPKRHQDS